MNYIIASFRSRTQVFSYFEKLKKYGINAEIVSTPHEISMGCGLAVKFSKNDFFKANQVLKLNLTENFMGFYSVTENGLKRTISPI